MTSTETAPPAPETSRGIPVVSDAVRVIKAMFSPGDVYGSLNPAKPPFWGAWLFVSITFAAIQLLSLPFIYKAQQVAMAGLNRPVPSYNVFRISTLVGTPIISLLMILVGALILWVALSLTGGEGRYRQVMSILIFSWGPILVQQLVMWGILQSRGVDAITSALDARPAIGLDLALPAETTGFLKAFAAGINPFSIWCLVIQAVGLQTMLKVSKGSAWAAATISFLVSLVIGAALAGMFS